MQNLIDILYSVAWRLFGTILALTTSFFFFSCLVIAFTNDSILWLLFSFINLFSFVLIIGGFEDLGYTEGAKYVLDTFKEYDIDEQ